MVEEMLRSASIISLAAFAVALLPRCTSFGTGTADEPDERDGGRLGPDDGAVVVDAAPRPTDGATDAPVDAGEDSRAPADYEGTPVGPNLNASAPYTCIETTLVRCFGIAPSADTAVDIPYLATNLAWPIDRTTPSFAMLKVTSTDQSEGVRGGFVTVAIARNGNEQFGKKDANGPGDRNEGTAVAVVADYVYFARKNGGGGKDLEILEQKVDVQSLRITSSVTAYANTADQAVSPFAVAPDRLSLVRMKPGSPSAVLLHRRATLADQLGAPETKTIYPPLDAGDGIVLVSGASFYAYRRTPQATIVLHKYTPR